MKKPDRKAIAALVLLIGAALASVGPQAAGTFPEMHKPTIALGSR